MSRKEDASQIPEVVREQDLGRHVLPGPLSLASGATGCSVLAGNGGQKSECIARGAQ